MSDQLRTAMEGKEITVEMLAARVGVRSRSVERWLSGENKPHIGTQRRVARVLRRKKEELWP